MDAKEVPYGEIVEIWSRFRPESAPALPEPITADNYRGQAPAFGSVRFTPPTTVANAAYYATKYLTKYPAEGYPEWVVNRVGRLPRYGHSHRFFPRLPGHDPMCFCSECRGDAEPPAKKRPPRKTKAEDTPRRSRVEKTIGERIAECGQSITVVKVKLVELPDGSIVDGRGKYQGKIDLPYRDACEFLGVDPADYWQLEVDGPTVTDLEDFAKQHSHTGEAA